MEKETSKSKVIFLPQTQSGFEQIFREFYTDLCSSAFFYLKEKEEAEEVVQELFVTLWQKRETVEIHTSLKAYLSQSVRNRCLNVLKTIAVRENYKHQNQENRTEIEQASENVLDAKELQQRIVDAIKKLPPERQKVFFMSRYEGLKYREIAEKLDISIKTVEAQMGKALKFLREQLHDYLPLWLWIFLFFK